MKFTSVLAVAFTVAVASVSASPSRETNGERLARGLTPLPPQKRSGTPSYGAKRSSPSGSPTSCSTGSLQCCDSTGTVLDPVIALLLETLGVALPAADVLIGVTCDPIGIVVGSSSCSAQTVCCTDNSFGGVISIGCIPST
ncbi:fungal hydrophobin, partial [Gymnopus androsaceus JB14]